MPSAHLHQLLNQIAGVNQRFWPVWFLSGFGFASRPALCSNSEMTNWMKNRTINTTLSWMGMIPLVELVHQLWLSCTYCTQNIIERTKKGITNTWSHQPTKRPSTSKAFSPWPLWAVWLFRADTCMSSKTPAAWSSSKGLYKRSQLHSKTQSKSWRFYSANHLPNPPSTVPVEKSTWHCRDESHWRLWPLIFVRLFVSWCSCLVGCVPFINRSSIASDRLQP